MTLVETIKQAVITDHKQTIKVEDYKDYGSIQLHTQPENADILTALYALNNDKKFPFILSYDESLSSEIRYSAFDSKKSELSTVDEVVKHLQATINDLESMAEDKQLAVVLKTNDGYLIEKLDDSTLDIVIS